MSDPHAEYYNESSFRPGRHFRLRVGRTVTGFREDRDSGASYFSKDFFCWTTASIDFTHSDRGSELYDANRVMIFEHDVVKIRRTRHSGYTRRGWVHPDETGQRWEIRLFEEDTVLPLRIDEAPFREDLKVISQIYPDTGVS